MGDRSWKETLAAVETAPHRYVARPVVLGFGRAICRDRLDDGARAPDSSRLFGALFVRGKERTAWVSGAERPQEVVKIGDVVYVEPVGTAGEFGLRQVPEVNGAIVAMIRIRGACSRSRRLQLRLKPVRSRDAAQRQPGSAFKPFVYAAALIMGSRRSARSRRTHLAASGPGLPMWTPKNFEKQISRAPDFAARHRTVAAT